ncbi:MAG TPA: helix-turn-helix transcriptional regulator [Candidatus Limnocylindria bacterium]
MSSRPTRYAREGKARAAYLRMGAELRVARLTAGLSQARLGQVTGLSQSHISRVERGHRTADWVTAASMAAALGHDFVSEAVPSQIGKPAR